MTTRTPAAIFEEVLDRYDDLERHSILKCYGPDTQEGDQPMKDHLAQVRAYREEFREAMWTAACMREICGLCGRVSAVGFHVPDAIWQAVMGDSQTIACVGCFTRRADEKYVAWDKNIQFYPVSKRTHRRPPWKSTTARSTSGPTSAESASPPATPGEDGSSK